MTHNISDISLVNFQSGQIFYTMIFPSFRRFLNYPFECKHLDTLKLPPKINKINKKSPVRRRGFNPPEADKYQETVKPALRLILRQAQDLLRVFNSEKA